MGLRAQGATEYLVLLAVVLIVALVSVALLGFFPGMASDAQMTQSQTYWQSAQPIAITEWAAKALATDGGTRPYLRVRNNGAYPIRITGIVGADSAKTDKMWGSGCGIASPTAYSTSDYFYLAPGEEKYFGWMGGGYGLSCDRQIIFSNTIASSYIYVGGATAVCANSTISPGMVVFPSFGFEYIEYLDNGQQITKRQIGKPVIIKCLPAQ